MLRERLSQPIIGQIIHDVPDAWLEADGPALQPAAARDAYATYLWHRMEASDVFVEEAIRAQH